MVIKEAIATSQLIDTGEKHINGWMDITNLIARKIDQGRGTVMEHAFSCRELVNVPQCLGPSVQG